MSEFSVISGQHNISEVEKDLAEAIVSTLRLEIEPADIEPEAPLFGEGLGLELD